MVRFPQISQIRDIITFLMAFLSEQVSFIEKIKPIIKRKKCKVPCCCRSNFKFKNKDAFFDAFAPENRAIQGSAIAPSPALHSGDVTLLSLFRLAHNRPKAWIEW
jgi:hypothetical protein